MAGEILALLHGLQQQMRVAYPFVTHDFGVVVMLRGQVVEQGPVPRIFSQPSHAYTELLLSSVPEMELNWLDSVLQRRQSRPVATVA